MIITRLNKFKNDKENINSKQGATNNCQVNNKDIATDNNDRYYDKDNQKTEPGMIIIIKGNIDTIDNKDNPNTKHSTSIVQ